MKFKIILTACLLFFTCIATAETESSAIIIQGNGDKAQFERALKLASNMREILSKAEFEVVVFGPTVKLLTDESDEVPLIQKVQSEGIKIVACGRSLKTDNVSESSLASGVKVTPFGAVHIVNRQKQGWQYFKP